MHLAGETSWRGIGAGVLAGALWGFVFLTPALTPGFTPLQLSAGRYLAYGLFAAILIAPSWRRLRARLRWREWRALIWLSFAGNIFYYVCLAQAVHGGGIAMAALVIGFLPVAVSVVGSRDRGAVPLRRLLPSLLLSLAGLACIGWQTLAAGGHGSVLGLLCAFGALTSWTLYAVGNSRSLARLDGVSSHEWSLLTGVVTGAAALLLAPSAFIIGAGSHSAAQWLLFFAVVSGVALFCSVIGNGLWNVASRALPLSLTGQMIVFETIFATLYAFIWERRGPTAFEGAALTLLIAGVASCAAVHRIDTALPPESAHLV